MLIFIDKRSSEKAKKKLSEFGEVTVFETNGIVENYLNGHPDLFLCQTPSDLIVAPNLPDQYFNILNRNKIKYKTGSKKITRDYPDCAAYNSVVTEKFRIHKTTCSDELIKNLAQISINVNQGMTRCSLLSLDSQNYITSDKGIEKVLITNNLNVCYVEPYDILLSGKPYGQIGGTAGVCNQTFFFNGSLKKFSEGNKIKSFIENLGMKIIELSDEPLFDGGSIIFVRSF